MSFLSRLRSLQRAACALLLGLLASAGALAQGTYQLSAQVMANAIMFMPGPGVTVSHHDELDFLNRPGATDLQALAETSTVPNGGSTTALFLGRIGLLKTFASASHPYCCTIGGQTVTTGYSNGTALGRFYDTVPVFGAGLAPGTPVAYRVDFDISGSLSSPVFEMGGFLSVDGLAEVRLRDLTSFQEVSLSWNASRDAPGRYSLTLNTVVGHDLGLSGMLYASAYVSAYATTGRDAVADFYHSAGYSLVPSVAGLNTVGASGHDFLAPVPEPATALLCAAGVACLLGFRRSRVA